jgi:CelD/BcsL family acetyltransferase involved in cellulose biosynthesis
MNAYTPWRDIDQSRTATGLEAILIETPQALAEHAASWRRLELTLPNGPTFFQTFAFAQAAVAHPGASRPIIGLVRDAAGNAVLIAPLQVIRRRGLRVAGWLGGALNASGDGLAAPDSDIAATMAVLRAKLIAHGGVDLLELRYVSKAAALEGWLARHAHGRIEHGRAPLLQMPTSATGFPALHEARVSKSLRQQRARKRRRLADLGQLRLVREAASPAGLALLEQGLEMKRAWARARSMPSALLFDPASEALMRACAGVHPGFECNGLFAGDALVAFVIGLRGPKRVHFLLTTFEPTHEKLSPGQVLLEDLLAAWTAEGVTEVDFGNGENAYKLEWTDHALASTDYSIGLSLAGQAYARLILGAVEPALRKVYWAIPEGARRAISGALRRD